MKAAVDSSLEDYLMSFDVSLKLKMGLAIDSYRQWWGRALVLVDMSAAFDTTDHDIMFDSLRRWFSVQMQHLTGLPCTPPIALKS